MRKIFCDKCGYSASEPLPLEGRKFHKVVLRVETLYHVGVTIVEHEWCSHCVKDTLGNIPEPIKEPPPKSQELFDELVEAVSEAIREDA